MGAVQRQEGGSGTAGLSYVDMGAAQRQEVAAAATGQGDSYTIITS